MSKSCFRILALKCFQPTEIKTVVEERIKWMQKSLYYKKDWIKFYQGVKINDPKGKTITIDSALFDDQMLYGAPNLSVSISVIVGVNGAGKSSILDMIVRIMNNVSAAIMGENFSYSAAEHLHYVEYVYASLLFYMDGKLKMIDIKGRDITITEFLQEGQSEQYKASTPMILLSAAENPDETKPLKRNASQFKGLENFFYTIVSNYSMYAYNYRDYWKEATNEDRLKAINKKYNEINNPQEAIWLTGLFHKNDGYQAPIVLNPMRDAGIIDGPRENALAKEKLLSMLFYTDENDDKKKAVEHYPFRLINKKLSIVGLFLPFYENSQKWTKEWVLQRLDIKKRSRVYQKYDEISSLLIKFYTIEYELPTSFSDRKAYDYLIYKTLKIARTYKKYAKLYSNLSSKAFNEDLLFKHLIELKGNHSHITAKLRRTILYLKLEMYKDAPRMIFKLSDIDKQLSKKLVEAKKIMPEASIEDLLPPPIFNIDFQIVDQHKANSYTDKDMIPFEGLSSGERQIAYTVSNFLYHLININSVWHQKNNELQPNQTPTLRYHYVNVIFDEIELYFHPDLQRRFLSYIITALRNVNLDKIKGLNIIMVSHSPFVISDLPCTNVLFLGDKKAGISETFCANIHDMLNRNFFMDYSMGEIAQEELEHLFSLYNARNNNDKKDIIAKDLRANWHKYEYIVAKISDDYLNRTAKLMFNELSKLFPNKDQIRFQLEKLKQKQFELEQEQKKIQEAGGNKQ